MGSLRPVAAATGFLWRPRVCCRHESLVVVEQRFKSDSERCQSLKKNPCSACHRHEGSIERNLKHERIATAGGNPGVVGSEASCSEPDQRAY